MSIHYKARKLALTNDPDLSSLNLTKPMKYRAPQTTSSKYKFKMIRWLRDFPQLKILRTVQSQPLEECHTK
jgi:hypothetical protein